MKHKEWKSVDVFPNLKFNLRQWNYETKFNVWGIIHAVYTLIVLQTDGDITTTKLFDELTMYQTIQTYSKII